MICYGTWSGQFLEVVLLIEMLLIGFLRGFTQKHVGYASRSESPIAG
jgi:hypothetical protein